MKILHLSLKTEYFNAINDGTKLEEFRLVTPYWCKRLMWRQYDAIEFTLGYPKANDLGRRLFRPWLIYPAPQDHRPRAVQVRWLPLRPPPRLPVLRG
ncbi:MAG: ASCH domain-containing protein [Rhodoferax sp.]|nr:ASCH domain-containing protein [Rhodoferax sp.]